MLYFPNGRAYVSVELPVAVGSAIAAEGQALIGDTAAGGVFGVKPSTGGSTDNFVGVAVGTPMPLSFMSKVEEGVQGGGNTFTLARTPASGTLSVWNITAGAVVAPGGGGWTLAGNVVTLQAGTAGNSLRFTYRYAPTVNEARAIQGDIFPGGPAGLVVNQIGVIKNGIVYTTEFVSSDNWHAANPTVRVGANGLFTTAGSGTVVPCSIVAIPSVEAPYLGLMLNG